MLRRLVDVLEVLFLASLWLQTRVDLLHVFSRIPLPPVLIDYLYPYIYVSDILFVLFFSAWFSVTDQKRVGWGWLRLTHPSLWWGVFMGLAGVSLWLNKVGWWGWYREWKVLEVGLLAWVVSVRLKDGRGWWYLTVLWLGLMGEALLAVGGVV